MVLRNVNPCGKYSTEESAEHRNKEPSASSIAADFHINKNVILTVIQCKFILGYLSYIESVCRSPCPC